MNIPILWAWNVVWYQKQLSRVEGGAVVVRGLVKIEKQVIFMPTLL
jgi:hypothetical protein